jgi:hypothetical protein
LDGQAFKTLQNILFIISMFPIAHTAPHQSKFAQTAPSENETKRSISVIRLLIEKKKTKRSEELYKRVWMREEEAIKRTKLLCKRGKANINI